MTAGEIATALAEAETAFQQPPTNPEVDLAYVTDESLLQLRKACRLLDAAEFLLERNGHFTIIIEASFVAIERSLQYYVTDRGYSVPGQRHTEVYDRGVQAGLFSQEAADRLEALWTEHRSKSYYRTGIAGEYRAQAMFQLATAIHSEVVAVTRTQDCICD
ncbi:hypothetical protein [Halocatena marina]|uniref:hypothetical protein n=1 Tax=Halocatena marina TaxID=2934937 RepID=UPI00200CBB92|nr:hypothetical protein [Halocatena marina]